MKKIIILLLAFLVANIAQAASTALDVKKVIRSGVTQSAQTLDAVSGNKILLRGGEFLIITTGGEAITVTAKDQFTNPTGYKNDESVALGETETKVWGPFNRWRWADSQGFLQIETSGDTTNATVNVFRLPFGEPESQTK